LTEREWREASDMRRSTVLFAIIVAIAALLRFWGIGAGIPYAVGPDEPEIITRSIQMMRTGDYNPRFYDYPTLYIYLQLVVAVAWFLIGAIAGKWTALTEASPWDFLVWARSITAVFGTLTVVLVYRIGMRWGTRYALLAAALMAFMPMHVRESHYALTDVPLTFFVALAFLMTLRAHEQQRAAPFAWAGAAAGLAAATKYPGAIALTLPLVAAWMTPGIKPSRAIAALLALAGGAAAFLIAAPFTVLDLPAFLNAFAKLMGAYTGIAPDEPGWMTYLKHLRINLQWPAFLLTMAGVVLAAVRAARGPGRVRWTLALLFPLLFFWFVSRQSLIFGRYILPVVPFLCVLAAVAVVSGVSLLRRFSIPRAVRTALIAGLTAAALVPPAVTAINFNRGLADHGTKGQAFEWIEANVPKDAKIFSEAHGLILPRHRQTQGIRMLPFKSYEQYVAENVAYLVASSQMYGPYFAEPHKYPGEYAGYRRLFDQAQEVARFTPADPARAPEIRIFKLVP
jgi:4-amino-4-deoxy-L-arabinose transferase-like glycosyltransferase